MGALHTDLSILSTVVHQHIEVTVFQIRFYCHYEISSSSADDVLIKPPIAFLFFLFRYSLLSPFSPSSLSYCQCTILHFDWNIHFFLSMKIEWGTSNMRCDGRICANPVIKDVCDQWSGYENIYQSSRMYSVMFLSKDIILFLGGGGTWNLYT